MRRVAISNADDLIDSRNVIARIDESAEVTILEALQNGETVIAEPCPSCGRMEQDDETGAISWYTPCPSNDCPSHEQNEAQP